MKIEIDVGVFILFAFIILILGVIMIELVYFESKLDNLIYLMNHFKQ